MPPKRKRRRWDFRLGSTYKGEGAVWWETGSSGKWRARETL